MPAPGIMFSNEALQSASKILQKVYAKTEMEVVRDYQRVFNDYPNDPQRSFFQILALRNLGLLQLLPEGSAPALDSMQEGELATFNLVDYALAYGLTMKSMRYDPKAILKRLPRFLAISELITEELLIWQTINLGFLNAAGGGYNLPSDGSANLSLFNSAHVIPNPVPGAPSTFSNTGGTTAISVEALHNAITSMQLTVDDRGIQTYRTPKQLLIGANSTLTQTAMEIMSSHGYPYSNENRPNVVAEKLELVISRWITGATSWFVLAGKGDIEGDTHSLFYTFQNQNRQRTWTEPSTENVYHSTQFTIGYGVVDWRGTWGSQGS